MARPRSFDADAVLSTAMLLFWERGYEATSIRQLEAATGLNAPSLYGAFGDKEAIFTAALQRYLDVVIAPAIHASAGTGLAGIRRMFTDIELAGEGVPPGCLLAVTSSEAGALGESPTRLLSKGIGEVRTAIRDELGAAVQAGEMDAQIDIPATADALVALYEGIQVLRRSSTDHVDVGAIAGPVLDRLLASPS